MARLGEFAIPLCPDPACTEEGVATEQLLIVAHQLLLDAPASLGGPPLWQARGLLAAAIRAEAARAAELKR